MVVFGGSFDPVHVGHLQVAVHASESLGGASVTMMLAPKPQLRPPPVASFDERWQMLCLACKSDLLLQPSRFEEHQEGPTRTIQTLQDLAELCGEPIVWVIGSDSLQTLPSWHQADQIANFASLFVLRRPNEPVPESPHGFSLARNAEDSLRETGLLYVAETEMPDVSATDIRQRIREGQKVSHLLPSSVFDHIIEHSLYQAKGP